MLEPNEAFDGSTPLQVIERGETDRMVDGDLQL